MSKRKRPTNSPVIHRKRLKTGYDQHVATPTEQATLKNLYTSVKTLNDYLYSKLPPKSRLQKKRLRAFATQESKHRTLLDTVLVGIKNEPSIELQQQRLSALHLFLKRLPTRDACKTELRPCTIDEILQFVIWTLFQKRTVLSRSPSHSLCHGLSQSIAAEAAAANIAIAAPGIIEVHPNPSLQALKAETWRKLFETLGKHAESIMLTILLDHALFEPIEKGQGNYFQLSGIPLYDLFPQSQKQMTLPHDLSAKSQRESARIICKPAGIKFARSRILYGKPLITKQDQVKIGLKHNHAFNRHANVDSVQEDVKILCYIFPKQFGLHNAFTSSVNNQEASYTFKDYSIREDEINALSDKKILKAPRRLRGKCLSLIQRIRRNHQRCSYSQLLRHYCSLLSSGKQQSHDRHFDIETSFLPYETPAFQVSAFCRSVVRKLLPGFTFGKSETGSRNWALIDSWVDRFVRMRRYETLSLHDVVNELHLKSIPWLVPETVEVYGKLSASDKRKREELLHEFVYHLFDSILIPLLRSNFYVTESGVHRNRLFYFRHDVWRKLSEPALVSMKLGNLRPLSNRDANMTQKSSSLGHSQIRLLPKDRGTRAIINLKRRNIKLVKGQPYMSTSINAQLGPLFSAMNYERHRAPQRLGSAMFSVGEIQLKLQRYLKAHSPSNHCQFYFAKVDIRSAFDTIPQSKLVALANDLLKGNSYRVVRNIHAKWSSNSLTSSESSLRKRFVGEASYSDEIQKSGVQSVNTAMRTKRQTVVSCSDNQRIWTRHGLKKLLHNHICQNIVKVGRKSFQQLEGIPQGSVLSSLLCSIFYADFEQTCLGFLRSEDSLLLRLIDDFLLISTDQDQAIRFALAMSQGSRSYGIQINPDKSLVNFDMEIDGVRVPRLLQSSSFPYCGLLINTKTLALSRDRKRRDLNVNNSLTVDTHGHSGLTFQRRMSTALHIQLQSLLLDQTINSKKQVMRTLVECFGESGMKLHQYRNSMPSRRQPRQEFVIKVVKQLITLATGILHRHTKSDGHTFSKDQVKWIASASLLNIFTSKQSQYQLVREHLTKWKQQCEHSMDMSTSSLQKLLDDGLEPFKKHKY